MDSPIIIHEAQTLSPSSSGRRTSIDSNSPEFEFWNMGRNPSFPKPNLLSADELFVDGVLLPLHLLSHHHNPKSEPPEPDPVPHSEPHLPDPEPPPPDPESEPGPGPKITSAAESGASLSASKRWRDIFKKGDKKSTKSEQQQEEKDKEKKKERKSGGGTSSAAELNINIWPFSRSRSAGNACSRPKTMFGAPGSRKVNSAPCSRSNSAGESKSRKWPTSPGRPGVHLGRSSPVWQVRRGGSGGRGFEPLVRNLEKGAKKDASESRRSKPTAASSSSSAAAGVGAAAKTKVLNINVPICMGYRNHLSCRSDENSAIGVGTTCDGGGGDRKSRNSGGGGGGRGGGGRGVGVGVVGNGGNLFNLRSLFTKKVY